PVSTSRGPMPRDISSSNRRVASSRIPGSSMRAGISSLRTSSRYSPVGVSGMGHLLGDRLHSLSVARVLQQREAEALAALDIGLGAGDGEVAHPLHEADALGDRDGAAGVEDV